MSLRITLATFAGVLFVAATATAGEAELDKIKTECAAQLGYSTEKCACIAGKAGQQLNDDQQKFMVAYIAKDEATVTAMQSSMPTDQVMAAGQLMSTAPDQCN